MRPPLIDNRIESIQFLRAFAASIVALGHAMSVAGKIDHYQALDYARPTLPTGAGVDLFFTISGFIMVHSSDRLFASPGSWKVFIRRRLTRIVPLYWFATAIFLALLGLDALTGGEFPNLIAILSSFFFIPSDSFKPVEGFPYPILSVGWTLNYEMFFYVLFACCIGFSRGRAVMAVSGILLLFVLFVGLAAPAVVPLRFWSQPIVLEFAAGMLIAVARRNGLALPDWCRLAMIAAAIAWFVPAADFPQPGAAAYGFDRLLAWGIPAALIMSATVLGPDRLPTRFEKTGALLGDASYSIYLIHPIVYVVAQHSGLYVPTAIGVWLFIAGLFVCGLAASIMVHLLVEKPLLQLIRGRTEAGRSPADGGGKASASA